MTEPYVLPLWSRRLNQSPILINATIVVVTLKKYCMSILFIIVWLWLWLPLLVPFVDTIVESKGRPGRQYP
jgi:hypothetical protein